MAGFRTHITTSTVLGVGYGAVGYFYLDLPAPACLLATGLCSVSGMLPDIDSDSGVPLRESLAFAASIVPMLMLDRLRELGLSQETIVLIAAFVYLLIRFGLGSLLKGYTVHRGMFHSLPAMIIFGEVAYLLCFGSDERSRYFKAGAVVAGFLSHLVLDEIWAVQWTGWRFKLKKSFGTAMKFWGDSMWANFSTYAKLALLTWVIFNEQQWMEQIRGPGFRHVVDTNAENPDVGQPQGGDPSSDGGNYVESTRTGPPNVTIRIPPDEFGGRRR